MLNQLDLSRVTLSRSIAREQHWFVRVLLWLLWLIWLGYPLCFGGMFASGFGRFLKLITDPVVQERLCAAMLAVVFVALFGLVSYFYHRVVYEAPELPQLLTMPLTTRQIFLRLLPRILEGTGLALPLVLIFWGAFAVGLGGWRWTLLGVVPVITFLTGIVSCAVSLCIVMYVYRPYVQMAAAVALSGATAVAVTSLQIGFSHNPSAAIALWDIVLRIPPIHLLIEICPGAWLAHWLMAATHDTGTAIGWMALILVASLSGAALVARKVFVGYTQDAILEEHDAIGWMALILVASLSGAALVARKVFVGYTQDAILEEHERRWTVAEKKEASAIAKPPTALLWLDRLYQRWFTDHQRGLLALTLRDAFEDGLARRALGMVGVGTICFFITIAARWTLPLLLAPKEAEDAPMFFIVPATFVGAFFGALSVWFPGWMAAAGQRGQRRGSQEVPLLEIVPFDPREYLSTCFRFLALLSGVTWLCMLPALFAAPMHDSSLAQRCAGCAGILACLLEVAYIFPILGSSTGQRHPDRTVWAEVKLAFKYLLVIIASGVVLAGADVGGGMLRILGLPRVVSYAVCVVVLTCVFNLIVYSVWLRSWREHNYDAEPPDPKAVYPSWFRGWSGG